MMCILFACTRRVGRGGAVCFVFILLICCGSEVWNFEGNENACRCLVVLLLLLLLHMMTNDGI